MNNLKILSDDDCLFIIVKHKNIPWDIRKIEDISGNPHPIIVYASCHRRILLDKQSCHRLNRKLSSQLRFERLA